MSRGMRILMVRMTAMGDVIHTLPAAATLKASFPDAHLAWVVDPKWAVLLEGNPHVSEVIPMNRRNWRSCFDAFVKLRREQFDLAIDFQGLIKSAVVSRISGASTIVGLDRGAARESGAALVYTDRFTPHSKHIVDRHLDLAEAAGASRRTAEFPLPPGTPEGSLPDAFVLASPSAGWASKEWPTENYVALAALIRSQMRLPLVLNVHPAAADTLRDLPGIIPHVSSVRGLIDATRRARAVIGVDSGPLHLAAALGKPGVAIFGPTDPARNGPYGGTMRVLRDPAAITTYKRRQGTDPSMAATTPEAAMEALESVLCAAC